MSRLKYVPFLIALLFSISLPILSMPAPQMAATDSDSFVTRSGSKFYLNGHEFKFVGFNLYDAAATDRYKCAWWPRFSDSELDATFKYMRQTSGATVLRFWAFQTYTKSGQDWTGMDRVICIAKSNGFKILPVLDNGPASCTSNTSMEKWQYQSDSWYVSGYKAKFGADLLSYRDYVKAIVTRYKDEPTIFGWVMMNDANTGRRETNGKTVLIKFATDVGSLIKSIDTKHLVTVGTQSNGATGASGSDFVDVYSLAQVDFTTGTDRAYWIGQENDPLPGSSNVSTLPSVTSADCVKTYQSKVACSLANAVQVVKKPFVMMDAGVKVDNNTTSRQARSQTMKNKMNAMFANGASGYLLWQWNKMIDADQTNKYDILQSQSDPLLAAMKTYAGYLPTISNPSPAGTPPVPITSGTNTTVARGVNLIGGWQSLYGSSDSFATPEQLSYLQSKKLNTFRVGFLWDHLQPTLNGALDPTYLAKMDKLVADAKARGQKIAFVPMPGKWKGNDVATSAVPQSAFNDMWVKLATHYKNESAIWGYDLINEPNMGDSWMSIAPSVIAAIRTVDMVKPIIVPTAAGGYGYYFKYHLIGLPMQDPANNLIYEAHFYFDTPGDGVYTHGFDVPNANLNIGVERAKDFVDWCLNSTQKCYAGEYGVPGGWKSGNPTCLYTTGTTADPRWLTILDNFLTYLDQNRISGTYWAGGPYGDVNAVGPYCDTLGKFIDGVQMPILMRHMSLVGAQTMLVDSSLAAGIGENSGPGLNLSAVDANVKIVEGKSTTYSIALNTPPTADVTIAITTTSTETTIIPSVLTFTPSNWSDAQTVTLTVAQNDTNEGARAAAITHDIVSPDDTVYDALPDFDYTVVIIDDEMIEVAQADVSLLHLNALSAVSSNGAGVAHLGDEAHWTFSVENTSGSDLTNVNLVVTFPDDDMEGIRATSDIGVEGTFHKGSLITQYMIGTLASGQVVTLNVITRLPNRAGDFTGTLSATVDGVPQAGNASLSLLAVGSLPKTGETPWWHPLVMLGLLVSALGIGFMTGYLLTHRTSR